MLMFHQQEIPKKWHSLKGDISPLPQKRWDLKMNFEYPMGSFKWSDNYDKQIIHFKAILGDMTNPSEPYDMLIFHSLWTCYAQPSVMASKKEVSVVKDEAEW